jgi:hypothetical protein
MLLNLFVLPVWIMLFVLLMHIMLQQLMPTLHRMAHAQASQKF